MLQRILGVFKLDVATFEEIEADQTATTQAFIVVLLVALLGGVGSAVGAMAANTAMEQLSGTLGSDFQLPIAVPTLSPVGAFISAVVSALVAWLLWSALTYFIGTRLFEGEADMGEMLRVIGFAQAPRLLSVLSFIPCIGALLSLAGWIWALVASFIGIRQGLDLDNGKTLLTVVISIIVVIAVNFLIGLILAPIFT